MPELYTELLTRGTGAFIIEVLIAINTNFMKETEKKNENKTLRERSAAYPAISLEDAVGYSTNLQAAFSKSPFSRENAVKEMGHQTVTGASGMKVSSLVHYDLLDRDGNAYRNSSLALRFAHQIDDSDFQEALKIAASSPKLYRALLNEFAGRAVPTALGSILVRNHQIGQKIADDVARIFIKTIEYAGLYQNGIVSSELPANEAPHDTEDTNLPQTIAHTTPRNPATPAIPVNHFHQMNSVPDMRTVELPSGIIVSYPKNLGFVFGKIAAFEEAVQEEMKKHESDNAKNDTLSAS